MVSSRYTLRGLCSALCLAPLLLSGTASASVIDRPTFNVDGIVIVWAADPSSNVPIVADFVLDTGNGATAATSGDVDLITQDGHTVVTGTLSATQDSFSGATGGIPFVLTNTDRGTINTDVNGDGIMDSDDAFTPFGLNNISNARVDAVRQESSFYVASNTAFSIDAEAIGPRSFRELILLLNTRMELSVTTQGTDEIDFGSQSQAPHSGGGQAGFAPNLRLWDIQNPRNVFAGDQATASGPGSIVDQSVRFDAAYSIAAATLAGYDLSLGTFDFEVEVIYTVYVP